MRPTYEGPEHIARADKVASAVEQQWACRVSNHLGAYSTFNRLIFDNTIPIAWLEIKCRSNAHNKYPTYMISRSKIVAAEKWRNITALPIYLAVGFSDAVIGYLNLLERQYTTGFGGREDRADHKDREECAFFNMSEFYFFAWYPDEASPLST